MTTNTGGPAFPCDLTMYDQEVVDEFQGMTLRDHFAGLAMQTMLGWDNDHTNWKTYAKDAYEMADAMLKAREA